MIPHRHLIRPYSLGYQRRMARPSLVLTFSDKLPSGHRFIPRDLSLSPSSSSLNPKSNLTHPYGDNGQWMASTSSGDQIAGLNFSLRAITTRTRLSLSLSSTIRWFMGKWGSITLSEAGGSIHGVVDLQCDVWWPVMSSWVTDQFWVLVIVVQWWEEGERKWGGRREGTLM